VQEDCHTGEHASTRPKLSRRMGRYWIHRADTAMIIERGSDNALSVSTTAQLALWLALNDEADHRRSNSFQAGIGFIARKAGVSKRTAVSGLKALENLGLVTQAVQFNPERKQYDESVWTIHPATAQKPSAKSALAPSASGGDEKLREIHDPLEVLRGGVSKDQQGRFPVPVWEPLPVPLYRSTADAKKAACEVIIKSIKASAKKVPIHGKTGEGTPVVIRHDFEPEAQEAIAQWQKRIDQITKALAG
jgi:DNA-binding transcriptional ArsR family regulator